MTGPDPLERIRSLVEEMERTSRAADARDAPRAAHLAEAARAGALGTDWEKVQKRVDRGETTLTDVFTGQDVSPEAKTLARKAHENVPGIVREVQNPDDEDLTTALEELATIRDRMALNFGEPRSTDGGGHARNPGAPTSW